MSPFTYCIIQDIVSISAKFMIDIMILRLRRMKGMFIGKPYIETLVLFDFFWKGF